MNNARTKDKSVKTKPNPRHVKHDKTCKITNCSCSKPSKFKPNKFQAKSEPTVAEEYENFLKNELMRYGLKPRRTPETKHFNSPAQRGVNFKKNPEDRLMRDFKVKSSAKSKTDPFLNSYIKELQKEINSEKNVIPQLPEEYRRKYVDTLKQELFLNKLTQERDEDEHLRNIRREIEEFRQKESQYLQPLAGKIPPDAMGMDIRNHVDNSVGSSENSSLGKKRKAKKRRTSKEEERERSLPQASTPVEEFFSKTARPQDLMSDISHSTSPRTPVSHAESKPPAPQKNYTTMSIQCELDLPETSSDHHHKIDPDVLKKLDIFQDLLPKLSAVIENNGKNLEEAVEKALKTSKIFVSVHERAVSPIRELSKSPAKEQQYTQPEVSTPTEKLDKPNEILISPKPLRKPKRPERPTSSTQIPKLEDPKEGALEIEQPPEHPTPLVANLLVNIENIKESGCLLSAFKSELLNIKDEIKGCKSCKRLADGEKHCDKHEVYTPLIKLADVGSRSEQIKLFNTLKNEVTLKKEMESQLYNMNRLEKELSQMRLEENEEKIKEVEEALDFTKSYLNNLVIKLETERSLRDQEVVLKKTCAHDCRGVDICPECSVGKQIHDLLQKVRKNIDEDLKAAGQKLRIQKLPSIDIRKPLQLQNTLLLNIPPTYSSKEVIRNNVACETVITEDQQVIPTVRIHTKVNKRSGTSRKIPGELKDKRKIKLSSKEPFESVNGPREDFLESSKTPSELGFRRTTGTQCYSNSSLDTVATIGMGKDILIASSHLIKRMNVQTQTQMVDEASSYLFGFREYLMKRDPNFKVQAREGNRVDVNLQISLDDSIDSVVPEKPVEAEPAVSKIDSNTVRQKSCEINGMSVVPAEATSESQKRVDSEDVSFNIPDKGRRLKAVERTPSVKKMFFPPVDSIHSSHDSENQQTITSEITPHNPYIEPKYRMKKFSINRYESDSDDVVARHKGDIFYKSLIAKEQLPERKATAQIEQHGQEKTTVDEPSENIRSINLEVASYDGKSLLAPVESRELADLELNNRVDNEVASKNGGSEVMENDSEPGEESKKQETDVVSKNEEAGKKEMSLEEDILGVNEETVDIMEISKIVNTVEPVSPHYELKENKSDDTKFERRRSIREPEPTEYTLSEVMMASVLEDSDNKYFDVIDSDTKINISNLKKSIEAKENSEVNEKSTKSTPKKRNVSIEEEHSPQDMSNEIIVDILKTISPSSSNGEKKEIVDEFDADLNVELPEEDGHFFSGSSKNTSGHFYDVDNTLFTVSAVETPENDLEKPLRKSTEHSSNSSRKFKVSIEEKSVRKRSISPTLAEKSESKEDDKAVLTVFPPTYRLRLRNSKNFEKGVLEDDVIVTQPNLLQSTKTFKKYESEVESSENSDLVDVWIGSKNLKQEKSTNQKHGNVSKVVEERKAYAKKVRNSVNASSLSEGEVKCVCENVSLGEIHTCRPVRKMEQAPKSHAGIFYKDNLSSHLVLDKERKHYKHWVTYYSSKKRGVDSESSTESPAGKNSGL